MAIFAKFPHLRVLTPLLKGFPRNFVTAVELEKKQQRCPYLVVKCDDMSIRFDTVLALDRQTDRRTEWVNQYRAVHADSRKKDL